MHKSNSRIKFSQIKEYDILSFDAMRRIIYAGMLMVGVLFTGTIGYHFIEKWNLLDSLYMTVITIATVGFHEVSTMSDPGRIFTMLMIFLGIGIGGYAIGTIAAFLIEGQMLDMLKGRKMVREITNLKNHTIVCGFGKIGREVCMQLAESNEPFIVIETDETKVDEALGYGFLAAVGEATDDDILLRAGIKHAKGLISAISDDSANVYLVLTARALNENLLIIARGVGEASRKKMLRAGASKVVSPYEIGARRMAALLIRPEIVDFMEALAPGTTSYGLRLDRYAIQEKSSLIGKRLDESYIKRDTKGALVLGIEKTGQTMLINPPGNTVMEHGDVLLAIGNDEQLELLQKLARDK